MSKLSYEDMLVKIKGMAVDIYKILGTGLTELNYHKAFEIELRLDNIPYETKMTVPYTYKGFTLSYGELDLYLPQHKIIIELKSIVSITPKEEAQVKQYIKHYETMSKNKSVKGILINFPAPSRSTNKTNIEFIEINI